MSVLSSVLKKRWMLLDQFHHLILIIVEKLGALGYWGIGIGMGLESACMPMPSEVVLPFAGYMVFLNRFDMLSANIIVNAGSLIGSLAAYTLGYYGGRPFLLKYGKYLFISNNHFNIADRWFEKYGVAAVFFGRLLPIIRTFISLPAGIARMDISKFIFYSLIGMIPWNFALIFAGYKFGQNWKNIAPMLRDYDYIIEGAIAAAIIFLVVKYIRHRRLKSMK